MTAKRTACVIGWPVAHSRSPTIHKFWLERHGIDGDYVRKAVAPDGIGRFFEGFLDSGLVGANVTVPHKEAAFAAVRRKTETAERLGAVNTVWTEGGELWGDNTDAGGFVAGLDEGAPGWEGAGTALVIGAGGAARAVVFALLQRGVAQIGVVNRTRERAARLSRHFGGSVTAGGLDELNHRLGAAGLVVNTTSAGLGRAAPLAIDWSTAKRGSVAADLLYVPLVTPFLAGAAAGGLRTVDGLGMLLHQAAPGFERWFGVRPAVDGALRRHILADLGEPAA